MTTRDTIGPTSQPHYPPAAVAGWMALWAQHRMERRRPWAPRTADRNAARFWASAERMGLVIQ